VSIKSPPPLYFE